MKLCPKCGRIAAYNSYFDAYICNYCGWDYRIVRRKIYLKKYHLESDRSSSRISTHEKQLEVQH